MLISISCFLSSTLGRQAVPSPTRRSAAETGPGCCNALCSSRHDECGANRRTGSAWRGGGISAASKARNCSGNIRGAAVSLLAGGVSRMSEARSSGHRSAAILPISRLPVFPEQPRNPSELGDVVRDERQALSEATAAISRSCAPIRCPIRSRAWRTSA